jgi:hypothetical protein
MREKNSILQHIENLGLLRKVPRKKGKFLKEIPSKEQEK